jgi:hypothetical protein
MSDKQKKKDRETSGKRRPYRTPRVVEEQSFEREALALCGKGSGASCQLMGGLVGAS